MENLNNRQEPTVYCGSKVFKASDIELEKLSKTSVTDNRNYLTVLGRIPSYFETESLCACMLLAFNYGEMKGRECERDMIKWNALATFEWMKVYHEENGCFPDTQEDLWNWEKAYVNGLEMKEGVSNV